MLVLHAAFPGDSLAVWVEPDSGKPVPTGAVSELGFRLKLAKRIAQALNNNLISYLGAPVNVGPSGPPPVVVPTLSTWAFKIMAAGRGPRSGHGGCSHSPLGTDFAMKIVDGCKGVNIVVLLWSAMLAWPSGGIAKIKGMVLGALFICGAGSP